ncbi:hypothetical protein MJO29_014592 [Puccinia striiformis f. sp. tritici]|nr:hypothetical protein MJO29_014592 [Puccinia striiformis f. sp. tritici]
MHAGEGWSPGDGIPRNARIDPVPQYGRINPIPQNGRINPIPQNGRINPVPQNGRFNPVPQNGRIDPVPRNGRIDPVPRNGRIDPVPRNGHINTEQAPSERLATLRNPRINTSQALTERVPIDAADNDVDGSQDGLAGPGEPVPEPQLADIHINYLFHVVQASNNAPSNPRARKRRAGTSTATDDLPKTMKLEAKDNKIIITWPVNNFNLSQFKREVIDALQHNVNEWLAVHAQDLENNGHLTWQQDEDLHLDPRGSKDCCTERESIQAVEGAPCARQH